jgi:hypothetical protein
MDIEDFERQLVRNGPALDEAHRHLEKLRPHGAAKEILIMEQAIAARREYLPLLSGLYD